MATGDTEALLRSIRRHTGIPDTHPSYGDTETLADATEELHAYILPLGMAERQELWAGPVGRVSMALEEGVATYSIPSRAVGAKVRAVRLSDRQDNPTHLTWVDRDEARRWRAETGIPYAQTVEGNTLRLHPVPRNASGYTLEVDVYLRPSALVLPEACGPLTANAEAEDGSTTLTLVQTADNAALFEVGALLDVVSASPPFETLALEVAVVSVAAQGGGVFEVVVDTEFEAAEGDYLCEAGKAPVVQAPLEWHPLLAEQVASRQLASLGDTEGAALKGQGAEAKARKATTLVRPRREDASRKVRNGMDRWRGY